MSEKEWTLDDTINEMKELREYDERVEKIKERVEKCNQLKNRIGMLSEAGAKVSLNYLVNESDNINKKPTILQIVDAIELGEEV